MEPKVTIVIAAYNAAAYLPKSLASAAAQTGILPEIIVADDASSDETAALMAGYPQVRYLRMAQNSGPSAARNAAFDQATGDWLAVLDADDDMRPERLARMVARAEAVGADLVLGNLLRVTRDGQPIDAGPYVAPDTIDPARPLTLADYVGQNVLAPGEQTTGYLKPLFRRAFLDQHKIRYNETLRNSEDFHIVAAVLAAGGKVVVAPEADYLYQVAEGSISHAVPPRYFAALIEADRIFAQSLRPAPSGRLREVMAARRRNLQAMLVGEQVMGALKARRPGRALMVLARHPAQIGAVLGKFAEALGKRVNRKRTPA